MVYRYFYDCEFIEDGRTIDLVSIGVVDEFGREFYAISTEFDDRAAVPWVRRNVLDRLPSPADPAWRSRERIRDGPATSSWSSRCASGRATRWSCGPGTPRTTTSCSPSCGGAMPALPREIPRFTKDLRQLWDDRGRPPLPDAADAAPRRAGRRPAQPRPVARARSRDGSGRPPDGVRPRLNGV